MKPNFWIEIFLGAQRNLRGKSRKYENTPINSRRMPILPDFDALAKRKPAQARKIMQTLGF